MEQSIQQILAILKALNAPVLSHLNKGVTKDEVIKNLQDISLKPRAELITLYSLINGTEGIQDNLLGHMYFYPGGILLFLADAVRLYKEECIDAESWTEGFYPILTSGGGDFLLINGLDETDPFIYYSAPSDYRFDGMTTIYDSLESLFCSILQCYKEGAYQLGSTVEDMKLDGDKEKEVCSELNPASKYWEY